MSGKSSDTLTVDDCVVFLLGKAFQRVTQSARERLSEHGVSTVQYVVLSALWENDGLSGAQLTSRLRIDSATITGVIDRLVASELVSRADDATDRRIQRVQLTAKGRALRRPLETTMIELNREIAAGLGPRATAFWSMLADVGDVSGAKVNASASRPPKVKSVSARRKSPRKRGRVVE